MVARPGFPVVRQRWHHLTFLHWRYDTADLRRVVPPELHIEEIDGSAWVGMVLFVAQRTRLLGVPVAPSYPEINVRTYVRTRNGLEAVWFLSLEASSAPVVAAARTLVGVPYHWAAMRAETAPDRCRYRSRRRFVPAGCDVEVVPGEVLTGDRRTERHERLTARLRMIVPRADRRLSLPIRHEPWLLHDAAVVRVEESLLTAAGLPPAEEPPEGCWSPGLDAEILTPERANGDSKG